MTFSDLRKQRLAARKEAAAAAAKATPESPGASSGVETTSRLGVSRSQELAANKWVNSVCPAVQPH